MFTTWLDTFVEEKGIDVEEMFEVLDEDNVMHLVPCEVVIEFLKTLPFEIQQNVKAKLVLIDFKNGDVLHFIKYMASAMVKQV